MRLSCALVACNDNPKYLDFWPVVKQAWWDVVGIPCIMVYVADTIPDSLKSDPAVRHFKPIEGWPTATQAQVIRLLYPALLKGDSAVVLSDIDMVPLQKDYFINSFAEFRDNQIASLRGIDEGERQVYMCYVAGSPATWAELFEIRSMEDIYSRLHKWARECPSDGNHGSLGWFTDQNRLYDRFKEWQRTQPERVGLLPWTPQCPPRLCRSNPDEWYQWNPLLEYKLKNKLYVDFHMPPYNQFQTQIIRVINHIKNHVS
jgi:hypothetical protein